MGRNSWRSTTAVLVVAGALGAQSIGQPLVAAADEDDSVTVARDLRGVAHLVGTVAGHPLTRPAGLAAGASDEIVARAHLATVLPLFAPGGAALRLVRTSPALRAADADARIVRFEQTLGSVPVIGGDLTVVLDRDGGFRSALGELTTDRLGAWPDAVSPTAAARTALAASEAAHLGETGTLRAGRPARAYLDPEVLGIPASEGVTAGPVWQVEVSDHAGVRDQVLVDARTGGVAFRIDGVTPIRRVACDQANRGTNTPGDCKSGYARIEGKTATVKDSAARSEVDNAFAFTGTAATFYATELGIDLTSLLGLNTGDGIALRSTVRYCRKTTLCEPAKGTAFNNAFWNGRGMFYGTGFTGADDVVAHELTHGFTERTSHLMYLYQSGAINESMSDLFGEMVDLTDKVDGRGPQPAWSVGEDIPLKDAPLRNMADPTRSFGLPQPDRMTSRNWSVDPFVRDFGGVHHNSGVGNKTAYLIAAGSGGKAFNGQKVGALGISKTATLYARVQRMLPSGADYADLGLALNQACADLTGTRVRNGGAAFTAADCANVARAVAATELARQPIAAAAAPEVGYCPAGTRTVPFFVEGFEGPADRFGATAGWGLIDNYARSGKRSAIGGTPATYSSNYLALRTSVMIPRGVRTYLRFAHSYSLEQSQLKTGATERYYDGAVVDLRVGTANWATASAFPWQNGPTRTIRPLGGGATYRGFGGTSNGYQSSLLDLSSLAGQYVAWRWRLTGDKNNGGGVWYVDDATLLACGGDLPSEPHLTAVKAGKKFVAVKWTAPYFPGSGVTSYRVTVTGGGLKKARIATVPASKGVGKVKGLKPHRAYTVTVAATSRAGAGPAAPVGFRTR